MSDTLGVPIEYWANFGLTVAIFVALVVGLFAVLLVIHLALTFWPRFYIGVPENPCEWHCYDARKIITRKDGADGEAPERGRLIQQHRLKWWFALGSRRNASWIFGLLKWEDDHER